MRRLSALTAVVFLLPSLTRAQEWRAPASCARAGFVAELARLHVSAVDARVQVDEAWKTTLSLQGATRTLQLASCADAQRTAALLIATSIAPERAEAPRKAVTPRVSPRPAVVRKSAPIEAPLAPASVAPLEPTPVEAAPQGQPPAQVEAAPEPEPPPPRPLPVRAPAPRTDTHVRLRVGGTLAVETLPAASGGPTFGVELARGHLVSWLDARYLVARRTRDGNSDLRAELDLFTLSAGAAWLWNVQRYGFGPLLELEGGVLRARGEGERNAQDALAPWLAANLGGRAQAHLYRRASLSMFAAASLPFWRPGVQLADEPAFYTTSPIAFRLGFVFLVAIDSTKAENAGQ